MVDANSWYQAMSSPFKGVAKHAVHGTGRALPFLDLGLELPPALARDRVVPRAPVVLARAPLGANPSAPQHSLERWIERTLVDVEDVARDLTQLERQPPSMHGLTRQQRERQHLEGALEHLGARVGSGIGSHWSFRRPTGRNGFNRKKGRG